MMKYQAKYIPSFLKNKLLTQLSHLRISKYFLLFQDEHVLHYHACILVKYPAFLELMMVHSSAPANHSAFRGDGFS